MKINLRRTHLLVALGFFGLPLGFGNNLAQPAALLLITPIIITLVREAWRAIPILALVVASSIYNTITYPNLEHSLYQFIRTGIPFAFLCILLACYKDLEKYIKLAIEKKTTHPQKIIDKLLLIYTSGQLLQISLSRIGLDIANAASKTETLDRILLFPTSSSILIFLYACIHRKYLIMGLTAAVLLAAGSKAVLAAMMMMFIISVLKTNNIKSFLSYSAAGAILAAMVLIISPTSMERLNEFLHEDRGADTTREYEIYHAKESLLSGPDTIFFGNGLGKQLTPGVPTNDPKWLENSKYDIENGYWGAAAKLGIIGTILFLAMLYQLPRNTFTVALLLIWALLSFKTSYQFFTTFDGCYLLIWSAVFHTLDKTHPQINHTLKP